MDPAADGTGGGPGLARPWTFDYWLEKLAPHEYYSSTLDIDPAELAACGIRGLILDLDNTLAPWKYGVPTPELASWVVSVRQAGIRCHIVSNHGDRRVMLFSRFLGIDGTANAAKPAGKAFRAAMKLMGTAPGETAVVGDQLFTDILGGRRQGCHTILVVPACPMDLGWTRLMRRVERAIFQKLQSRGLVPAEPRRCDRR